MALIPLNKDYLEEEDERCRSESLSNLEILLFVAVFAFLVILFMYLPDKILLNGFELSIKPIIILLAALLILSRFIVKFDEYERGVVFRFGKFEKVVGPGWKIILPIIERYVAVDTRLRVYTIDPREVVTRDGISFTIGAAVFMYVSNPRDAVINVGDYKGAVIHYVEGALRSICGSSTSDYVVSHMNDISKTIKDNLNRLSVGMKGWGIVVERIEIKQIQFPQDVQDAMHKKAIKDMESKLAVVEPSPLEETKKQDVVAVDDKKTEYSGVDKEVEDYEKRIREIKKRIGLSEF